MSMTFNIYCGDSLEVVKSLKKDSIDSIVTDPPCGISFMNSDWDGDKGGKYNWIKWLSSLLRNSREALKPGGFLLCWSLPRTSHWTMEAIERSGFEIKDIITHLQANNIPKGKNAYKDLLKNGIVRPELKGFHSELNQVGEQWILARNPVEKSLRSNLEKYGTGALNIDATRLITEDNLRRSPNEVKNKVYGKIKISVSDSTDRFTNNVVITDNDYSISSELGDKSKYFRTFRYSEKASSIERNAGCDNLYWKKDSKSDIGYKKIERRLYIKEKDGYFCGNIHHTIKPISLMSYFVKLITPVKGTVLDVFMGSGTTGIACIKDDFNFVGIEKNDDYFDISHRRMNYYCNLYNKKVGFLLKK